ncbi:hypothetical protein O9929_24580 [Vibrio lentus]|nr:hypothetical protein [Vibrio lentus]
MNINLPARTSSWALLLWRFNIGIFYPSQHRFHTTTLSRGYKRFSQVIICPPTPSQNHRVTSSS